MVCPVRSCRSIKSEQPALLSNVGVVVRDSNHRVTDIDDMDLQNGKHHKTKKDADMLLGCKGP